MHTTEQLKNDLLLLGVVPGNTVLLHSSYKSLGGIEGGAEAFFKAFIELLGDEGTLVLPALSFDSVTRENPIFDIATSKSCVGYLSEYFRTQVAGVKRSLHATHSCCAIGKNADFLTSGHENDLTPVGENSPFFKLPQVGGKILMLGCKTSHNTSMHGVEETVDNPYCIDRKDPIEYTLICGDKILKQTAYRHNFVDENGRHIKQRYDKVTELLKDGEIRYGKVLDADCCLMDAAAVWREGRRAMIGDPTYFVEYPEQRGSKQG